MNKHRLGYFSFLLVIALALAVPALAQDQDVNKDTNKTAQSDTPHKSHVASGQKQKIKGVIVKREADSFTLRDMSGVDTTVTLTNSTKVEEKKGNPFRGSKKYATTQLLRGLNVEVEGRGDSSGTLVAEKIKVAETDLKVAQTVESRVTPVEGRVGEAENRLTQSEQNAQRLSGQIEELNAVSNAARGGAKAAQETADTAIAGVNTTNERITNIVAGLDEYEPSKTITVNFKVGSAFLSPEAKTALDEIATQAKTEKGYVIEVDGFASSEGGENLNRMLSQRRSEAVVRYLAENHMIPLRRIIMPFGYGAAQPVADNSTSAGRQQNRRVEVKILSNRGLTTTAPESITKPKTSDPNNPSATPPNP